MCVWEGGGVEDECDWREGSHSGVCAIPEIVYSE